MALKLNIHIDIYINGYSGTGPQVARFDEMLIIQLLPRAAVRFVLMFQTCQHGNPTGDGS